MANIMLTLDFGDDNDPTMLSGVLDGFSGVNNPMVVDSGWKVMLEEQAFGTSNATVTGVTMSDGGTASETGGAWTANPYASYIFDDMGDDDATNDVNIPMGFHGAFDANFSNGEVAGAYAAEVEK